MGKLTGFYISFTNNQNGIFTPGETITGSVTVELNAPMEMRGKLNHNFSSLLDFESNHGTLNTQ